MRFTGTVLPGAASMGSTPWRPCQRGDYHGGPWAPPRGFGVAAGFTVPRPGLAEDTVIPRGFAPSSTGPREAREGSSHGLPHERGGAPPALIPRKNKE